MKFISFDLETTGLKSKSNAITEVAFIKFDGGQVVDKLVSLVNPEQPISQEITNITGITEDMIKDKPNFKTLAPQISAFIGNDLLVAYNAPYDKGFLNVGFYNSGIHSHFNALICAMSLTAKAKGLSYWPKLAEALTLWSIPLEGDNFHRAEFDAYHNGLIFQKAIESVDPKLLQDLEKQLKIPNEKYEPELYAAYVLKYGVPPIKKLK